MLFQLRHILLQCRLEHDSGQRRQRRHRLQRQSMCTQMMRTLFHQNTLDQKFQHHRQSMYLYRCCDHRHHLIHLKIRCQYSRQSDHYLGFGHLHLVRRQLQ